MKTIAIVVLVLTSIMVISLAIGATILSFSVHNFETEKYEVNEESSINLGEAQVISIDFVQSDIHIIPIDSGMIEVTFYGTVNAIDEKYIPTLKVEKRGAMISIEEKWQKDDFANMFSDTDTQVEVYIPKYYTGDIEIEGVSGDIELEGMPISGFKSDLVSGDINLELVDLKGDIDINTVSGDIEIEFADTEGFNVEWSTVSGDFKNDFSTHNRNSERGYEKATYKNGKYSIDVNTVSGDFSLKQKDTKKDAITNFEECVAAGNPVMESYPRQCRASGKTFVEVIEAIQETTQECDLFQNEETGEQNCFGCTTTICKDPVVSWTLVKQNSEKCAVVNNECTLRR